MIRVSLLNKAKMIVNADMIETIESAPDTIITLTTGRKIICLESADEVINMAIAYHSSVREFALLKG